MLAVKNLSSRYSVRTIGAADICDVYDLYQQNTAYYAYEKSEPTIETVQHDLTALPLKKEAHDKFYVGYYENDALLAVMDLIRGYPDEKTIFIGLFMLRKSAQGRGIGTQIIEEAFDYLRQAGFSYARLGCIKGNIEGERFWKKQLFLPTGAEMQTDCYTVTVLQRPL